jgi:predicted ribosome quality control (RQC) complex YloA/Tae2 family protein
LNEVKVDYMREMSSLELKFLVEKIKPIIVDSRIQKVKQVLENTFLLELYKRKERRFLIFSNKILFLSKKSYRSRLLTSFCQTLRKHLNGQVIQGFRQHEFDRIVELETKDYLLILELFGKGNIVLINKPERKIINALEIRSWKGRSLRPRKEYSYPPSRVNPFKLDLSEFKKYFGKKEVVKVLAKDFGFGGKVAERMCEKLGIDKGLKEVDTSKLYEFIENIEREFKEMERINEELEKEFEHELSEVEEEKESERLERIRKQQEEALRKWEEKEKEYRKIGRLLYEKYEEVKRKLDSGKRKIEIDGLIVELDPRKSVQKNAGLYFEKAKKARRKIEGIKKAMKDLEERLKKEERRKKKAEIRKPKEWYEKFRWFISSDGFLVVAGKDARTNEKLIRKYMKDSDLVFHADITGSPFVLIKNPERKKIPEQTIKEAAEFCGSYSKAWKVGINAVDVYYVKPEQVKKEGGLPTGSFMIYGKRNWVRRIPVKITLAVEGDKIYYGPEDMIKKKTSKYVVVVPGSTPAHEIAVFVSKKFRGKIKLEEIEKVIPYGKGEIV